MASAVLITAPGFACGCKNAGESYGRSLCEEVLGDLNSLESLSKAIVEGSLISAKAMFLVNPNGVTRADTLARAENGAIVAATLLMLRRCRLARQQT